MRCNGQVTAFTDTPATLAGGKTANGCIARRVLQAIVARLHGVPIARTPGDKGIARASHVMHGWSIATHSPARGRSSGGLARSHGLSGRGKFTSRELDMMMMLIKEQIIAERRHKLEMEIETAARIKRLGLHPLDVLDDMFHTMMALRKAALKAEYPQENDEEIINMMRQEEEASRRFKRRTVM